MVKIWSRAISVMLEEWEKLQALAETSRSHTVKGGGGKGVQRSKSWEWLDN